MILDHQQVRHIAKLARLTLSDAEVEKFAGQLTSILDWVGMLGEVNVDGVKETNQVTGLTNVMADDVAVASECTREELLECSELPVESKQVKVKSVL